MEIFSCESQERFIFGLFELTYLYCQVSIICGHCYDPNVRWKRSLCFLLILYQFLTTWSKLWQV